MVRNDHVNLWETLISAANKAKRDKTDEAVPYRELLVNLGKSSCLPYQELSLNISDGSEYPKGWLLKVFACQENGFAEILIPEDRNLPVQILHDERKNSKHYNDIENY